MNPTIIRGTQGEMYLVEGGKLVQYQGQYKGQFPQEQTNGCPPHNFVPYAYQGLWAASVPPPTMLCTKCGATR